MQGLQQCIDFDFQSADFMLSIVEIPLLYSFILITIKNLTFLSKL